MYMKLVACMQNLCHVLFQLENDNAIIDSSKIIVDSYLFLI